MQACVLESAEPSSDMHAAPDAVLPGEHLLHALSTYYFNQDTTITTTITTTSITTSQQPLPPPPPCQCTKSSDTRPRDESLG